MTLRRHSARRDHPRHRGHEQHVQQVEDAARVAPVVDHDRPDRRRATRAARRRAARRNSFRLTREASRAAHRVRPCRRTVMMRVHPSGGPAAMTMNVSCEQAQHVAVLVAGRVPFEERLDAARLLRWSAPPRAVLSGANAHPRRAIEAVSSAAAVHPVGMMCVAVAVDDARTSSTSDSRVGLPVRWSVRGERVGTWDC